MKRIFSLVLSVALILSAVSFSSFAVTAAAERVLVLPAGLQEIGKRAFAGNNSISTLLIPNEVTSIGPEAFEGCTGLTEVSIASRNVIIANDAFKNCSREIIFYAHNSSTAMLWAMAHGYKCVSLDDDSDHLARFSAMIAHSGFDPSLLASPRFASMCLIVRTPSNMDRLPDISAYNPIDIFRSDDHLYYIQFDTEGDTEDCFGYLNRTTGIKVEPDRVGASNDVSAQSVTIKENWGTNDTMGFDVYAPFVAQNSSGSVTIAVIDSGVSESSWGGNFSTSAISFVGGSAYSDSARHGSKVVSIINDCVGSNKSKITLLPIKVVNSSSMYRTSVIIEGIKHAYTNGANIINMSLGWDSSEGISPEIEHQINVALNKGILIVAAAGNGSGNVMYPASCDGVLAVSALAYSSTSGYSVRSRTGSAIDYTAPGMYLRTSSYDPVDAAGDILGAASTSFAAPQITAALALIKLDSTRNESPISVLNSCCIAPEGVSSSAYGRGLPQLQPLGVLRTIDIALSNSDGNSIPSRLWLADSGNDFMLTWKVLPENASNKAVTVTSSKTSVISVRTYGDSYALISAKGTGEAVISVSNGEITKEISIVVEKPVTEILIAGTDGTMIVGQELDLAISVLPENANNRAVQWKSTDENVLAVSDTGHLIARAAGNVTITCEALDGYGAKGQVEITVIEAPDATDISLSAEEKDISSGQVTLEVGEELTLIPKILPEKAPQECLYSCFPKGTVTVTEDGTVRAVAAGEATIVATATTGQNVYTGLKVTVVIYPTSVRITADKTTLNPGETTLLTYEVFPETATDSAVTWSSRNPAVATVNSITGQVTALTPGTAEIVCTTSNGIENAITMTVKQPITITFDTTGGNCSEPSRSGYSGDAIGSLPSATRNYWTFDGWYTAANGGTLVSASSAFTKDTTVYAHWIGLPYIVFFNANGGTCDTATIDARVGNKLGSLPAAARENHTFTGWYTAAADGEGTKITADYIQNNNSNLTVYAHWTAHPYTIHFEANGGECDTKEMTGTVDAPIGVLPEATRDYYVFDGWFTKPDGGTQITESYTKNTASEVYVYAHWTPKPYVMKFNANGGNCDELTRTCMVDTEIGEPPVPTRSYYEFAGWYTEGENSIHVTAAYQQATTEPITVYALWTPHEYTMSFDPNGGNYTTESIVGIVDKEIGILPAAYRDYYDWDGWYTAKTGGSLIDERYVNSTDADLTVYAHWTPHHYTMKFDSNIEGATCSPTTKQGTVGVSIGALPTPLKQYYTFIGWFTAKAGGTQIINTYVQYTDQEIAVYAQWRPDTYTMKFDANGGVCSTPSKTGSVDAAIGTLPSASRELYTFKGWFTSDGTQITAAYVQNTTNSITVYAHWEALPYTMLFDGNGNSAFPATVPSPSTRTYYADTAVGSMPTPTRNYHRFDGWFTSATGGTRITSAYAHQSTSSITVYAHWTPYTFSLNLNPGGGSCSETVRTCSVGVAIGALPTPTRDYYTFKGWYDAATGGNKVDAGKTYLTNTSTAIYAQWTENPGIWTKATNTLPSGARIIGRKWTYTETQQSTTASINGWTCTESGWVQTGSGSVDWVNFSVIPGFDKTNALYAKYNNAAPIDSETTTQKRVVSTSTYSYLYWHWMYDCGGGKGGNRAIFYKKDTGSSSLTGNNYGYKYFGAFEDTTLYTTEGSNWSQNDTYYRWYKARDGESNARTQGSHWWYRTPINRTNFEDYTWMYTFTRDSESTTQPTGNNVSNVVEYVQYQVK